MNSLPNPSTSTSAADAAVREESLHGQPVVRLTLPSGDSAVIALHGAQVVSWWTPRGGEQLYLSPAAVWDGQAAVRGGVPICFPQFNQRGPLVKHGFARNLPWSLESAELLADGMQAVFLLRDDAQTRSWWSHGFEARLVVLLTPGALQMTLDLRNTGTDAWSFTGALHTYLRVPDIAKLRLAGLQGLARWDAVRDLHDTQQSAVVFDGEYDSVFDTATGPLRLECDGTAYALTVDNSADWGNVVVWNPGPQLCAQLKDMPADGYRHMLCVEAACVDRAVELQPGQRWSGSQRLVEPHAA